MAESGIRFGAPGVSNWGEISFPSNTAYLTIERSSHRIPIAVASFYRA